MVTACPLNRDDRLIEVKFTVLNRGTSFWEFQKCPLIEGDHLIKGRLIEVRLYPICKRIIET